MELSSFSTSFKTASYAEALKTVDELTTMYPNLNVSSVNIHAQRDYDYKTRKYTPDTVWTTSVYLNSPKDEAAEYASYDAKEATPAPVTDAA